VEKSKINYLVDLSSFFAFLGSAISGLVLYYFLPAGSGRAGLSVFLSIKRHTWVQLHHWFSFLFITLVAVHVILHWSWISCMTKNVFKVSRNCDPN